MGVASGAMAQPTLVLVHGGTVTSRMWDPVLPHLRSRVITPDLPGRRYRPADLATTTRGDWVDAVVEEIAAAGAARVVLVGHSSGGYVIPGVAALLPERCAHLVFVAATVPSEGRAPVDFLKPKLAHVAREGRAAMFAAARGRTLGGLLAGEPPIDTGLEIVENEGRMGLEAPEPLFAPFSWSGFPCDVPRTFVRCTRDRVVTPELVDVMVENMGGAAIVDLDAGHEVAREAPAELAALLDGIAGLRLDGPS
jgi:pimeloyl-ACP methyl ester carboxylesterase